MRQADFGRRRNAAMGPPRLAGRREGHDVTQRTPQETTVPSIEILGSGRLDERESAFPQAVQLPDGDVLCSFSVGGGAGATEAQTGRDAAQDIDHRFEVKLHESAIIESKDLRIEFIEVLEDSRCPAGVTCIWAGRARALIGISLGGEDLGRHERILEGGQGDLSVARAGGYLIGFLALDPKSAHERPAR